MTGLTSSTKEEDLLRVSSSMSHALPPSSSSSSEVGSSTSDAPGFVVEIHNLDSETEAEDLIALCQDFGAVVGIAIEQDVIRVAITAKVTFSSEAEARTAAMALDNQEADGRMLEAIYGGANTILKTILPEIATEQYAGHLSDRPPLPPLASAGSSHNATATSFPPAHASEDISETNAKNAAPEAAAKVTLEAEVEEDAVTEAGWSSPASTFAPSISSFTSSSNGSAKQDAASSAALRQLQVSTGDNALTADAWLAGETLRESAKGRVEDAPAAVETEENTVAVQPSTPTTLRWNAAAPAFAPSNFGKPAEPDKVKLNKTQVNNVDSMADVGDDSGVWLSTSPKEKAIPIRRVGKAEEARAKKDYDEPLPEVVNMAAGVGGFVSARSMSNSSAGIPTSPTGSEASTATTIPRSPKLKSSAKAFVPTSMPPTSPSAAFLAGQALAMAQFGMSPMSFLPSGGYVPTLLLQNSYNPEASTYQPAPYGAISKKDLSGEAKAFVPSSAATGKSFAVGLEDYTKLLQKAGIGSMADLEEMLDDSQVINAFVDDLRREYPKDLSTFKDAFKMKVQLKKALQLQ